VVSDGDLLHGKHLYKYKSAGAFERGLHHLLRIYTPTGFQRLCDFRSKDLLKAPYQERRRSREGKKRGWVTATPDLYVKEPS
jgi:hypothetical protein